MQISVLLFIYLIGLLYNKTYAAVLLVPSAETKYAAYNKLCTNPEYLCTTDYFLSILKNKKTELFDNLIDSVDLNSTLFIGELRSKIIDILNVENLSRIQLLILIDLLKQVDARQPALLFKILADELVQIKTVLDSAVKPDTGRFAYIFKEIISVEDAVKIKTTVLQIPLYIIDFSTVPYKTSSYDFKNVVQKPLLTGSCGKSQLTYKMEIQKYCDEATK